MKSPPADLSPSLLARIAGGSYLVIILCGIFAEFVIRSRFVVEGDPAATAANILASEPLFRASIVGDLVMLIADVVVAAALFVLFRPVSESLSILVALLRLAHGAVYGASLLALYLPPTLLGDDRYLSALGPDAVHAFVELCLEAHAYGWVIALSFFGVQCFVLGLLVMRSGFLPRILGVLLICAAVGYVVDSLARTILTNYADYEAVFSLVVFVPALVAELAFCLRLLVRGVPGHPAA